MGDLKRNPEPETERQRRDQRDPAARLEHARNDIRLRDAGLRRFDPEGKQERDQQGNGHHRWFEPAENLSTGPKGHQLGRHGTSTVGRLPHDRARDDVIDASSRRGGSDNHQTNRIRNGLASAP